MAARQRRSLSLGSNHGSSYIDAPYSLPNNNKDDPRCTCPRPSNYVPPHGRAVLQTTRPQRHYSLIPRSATPPPMIDEYPLRPSNPSYSCRYSRPQFYAESVYPPACGYYDSYAEAERRWQNGYFPNPKRAQTLHLGYGRISPENTIRQVYRLRAFPKQYAQLFVAEYDYLIKLRRYSTMQAEWTLPSFQPYYSVVYFRSLLANPVCCDSFRNVCIATVGGREPYNSSPDKAFCSRCGVIHRSMDMNCCQPYKDFQRNQDSGTIHVCSASSRNETYSEPLTLENDIYDTGSAESSSSTRVARRRPYIPEETTSYCSGRCPCSSCAERHCCSIRSTPKSRISPSVVRWLTTEEKRSVPHGCATSDPSASSFPDNYDTSTTDREREAINELHDLERFLGLNNTAIGGTTSAKFERPTCSPLITFSNVSTANPICQCPVCVETKGLGEPERGRYLYPLKSASHMPCNSTPLNFPCEMDKYGSCMPRSPIMASVPSMAQSTACEMQDPHSPSFLEYASAPSHPNETSNITMSGPRDDSRSGGRDTRRPTIRAMCDEVQGGVCSDSLQSVSTAHPIFDPNCNQCAEARFADRLCEALQESCSCTPVIRTDPYGSISLLNTSAVRENDLVMDKQHKKSLLNYISRATKRGAATVREAVMYWVRTKAARNCRSRKKKRS